MTSQITKDVNNVYYDIVMQNATSTLKPATFLEERNQDIISKASDYQMSIVRFAIPGYTIPITVVETLGIDVSTLAYSVSLSRVGDVSGTLYQQQTYLQWVPESNIPTPGDFVDSTSPYSFQYYSLYNYQAFVNIVNTAFATCFTLLAAQPLVGGDSAINSTSAPYIVYNPVTKLMTLVAQQTYVNSVVAPISIYMNQKLFFFFNSFNNTLIQNPTVSGGDVLIDFRYTYENQPTTLQNAYTTPNVANTNPTANTPVYAITQDYAVLYNWNSLKSIVFTTGLLPTRKEYTPSVDLTTGILNNTGAQNFLPIVTDFVPNTVDGTENRSTIIYNPSAEYRMVDLTSNEPIRKIQLSLYWQDARLRLYPINIGAFDLVTVKMLFRRIRF